MKKIELSDDDGKASRGGAIDKVPDLYGKKIKDRVKNSILGEKNDNEKSSSVYYSWNEVIELAMRYNNVALSIIEMNHIIHHKFFLYFTSEINGQKISEEQRKTIINYIIDDKIEENNFREILNKYCDNPECKLPNNIEEINNNGPIKLKDLSLYMLGNYTSIPRSVEISENRFVTIVKTSATSSRKQIYTIRYGIKNPNVPYPTYKGISSFIILGKKINFLDILCAGDTSEFRKDLFAIKDFLLSMFIEDIEINLNEIKKGKTSTIGEMIVNGINFLRGGLLKSKIYDAGENAFGHKVLFVQTNYINDKLFSQLEMNLFNHNGKNIIYIGSLGKDKIRTRFINVVPGLISRIRDIYKSFDNSGKIEIWSFKADKDGKAGIMRKDTIGEAISRYKRKNN